MAEWVIPCNIKYYDVDGAFRNLGCVNWKQVARRIDTGDIVYIYVAKPVSAIRYKCRVNKANLKAREIDDLDFVRDGSRYLHYGNYMELELLKAYDGSLFGLHTLRENGFCGNIQNQRRIEGTVREFLLANDV